MENGQRVLVIDGLSETEQVLRAVFGPQGAQVDRIRRSGIDSRLNERRPAPDVVVIHQGANTRDSQTSFAWPSIPQVVIGSAEILQKDESSPERHYLQEPFDYGELIDAVQRLLDKSAA